MKKKLLTVLTGILMLVLFSACNATSGEQTLSPTEAVQLLSGVYTTQISEEDLNKFEYSNDPNLVNNIGSWQLSLQEDGTFTAEMQGQSIADGKYSVNDNEFTIETHCVDCDCNGSIDRFYWALKDDQLSFSHKAGNCKDARLLLTTHPLKRSP